MTVRKSHRGSIPRGATPKRKRDVGASKNPYGLFELTHMLARLDHVAGGIVNLNHRIM